MEKYFFWFCIFLFKSTLNITLLGRLIKLMVLYLLQTRGFPFFVGVIIRVNPNFRPLFCIQDLLPNRSIFFLFYHISKALLRYCQWLATFLLASLVSSWSTIWAKTQCDLLWHLFMNCDFVNLLDVPKTHDEKRIY